MPRCEQILPRPVCQRKTAIDAGRSERLGSVHVAEGIGDEFYSSAVGVAKVQRCPDVLGDLNIGCSASTPWATILGRTLVEEGEDLDVVFAIQDQYTLTPLSQWGAAQTEPPADAVIWQAFDPEADPLAEWKTINRAMLEVPPAASDAVLVHGFSLLGIGPGLDVTDQDEATQRGLARAAIDGRRIIAGAFAASAASSSCALTRRSVVAIHNAAPAAATVPTPESRSPVSPSCQWNSIPQAMRARIIASRAILSGNRRSTKASIPDVAYGWTNRHDLGSMHVARHSQQAGGEPLPVITGSQGNGACRARAWRH